MYVRLVSYNIRVGGAGRENLLAKVLLSTEPDLVILQEATDCKVVSSLAYAVGLSYWSARSGYSLALLSRLPIAYHHWHHAKQLKHPFLEAVIETLPIRVFGVHLTPRLSNWSEQKRISEIGFHLGVVGRNRLYRHILIGDFNAVAPDDVVSIRLLPVWIRFLVLLSGGHIRREAIKSLLRCGYVDGFRGLHPDQDGFTLPTPTPHIRLDYIFVPSFFFGCLKECTVVDKPLAVHEASDHYPLLAVLGV